MIMMLDTKGLISEFEAGMLLVNTDIMFCNRFRNVQRLTL